MDPGPLKAVEITHDVRPPVSVSDYPYVDHMLLLSSELRISHGAERKARSAGRRSRTPCAMPFALCSLVSPSSRHDGQRRPQQYSDVHPERPACRVLEV